MYFLFFSRFVLFFYFHFKFRVIRFVSPFKNIDNAKRQAKENVKRVPLKDVIHNNSPGKRYFSRFYCCLRLDCTFGASVWMCVCVYECVLPIFRYSFSELVSFRFVFRYCFAKICFELNLRRRKNTTTKGLQFIRSDWSSFVFQCRFCLAFLLMLLFKPTEKIVSRKFNSQDCCCGWWLSVYKFWLDLLVYFIHSTLVWANTHECKHTNVQSKCLICTIY